MTPTQLPNIKTIANALGGDVVGNNQVAVPGPGHSAEDRSLSITVSPDAPDGFLVFSHAGDDAIRCKDYVRQRLRLPAFAPKKKTNGAGGKPPVIARYVYQTADGGPYLQVSRTADKAFYQSRIERGQWVPGAPKGPKVPYRLPELLTSSAATPVHVVEGEKDADNLAKLGFIATCNSGGVDNGKGGKWTPELNQYFKDRHVYILADNDHAGRVHAQHVASNLDPIAASVRVVELPDLPPKGDVSDWLKNDPTGAKLVQHCKAAPQWDPTTTSVHAGANENELIAELADLSALDYAKRRKDAAEQIGIGVTELDKVVAEARGDVSEPSPERWAVEPWHEPVATADLLQSLRRTYEKHVVLPEHGTVAMALWCLHAWTIDASYVSPFLMFTSPEMRCGKSTALSLLYRTAPRTALASNISSASVFRYINRCRPTLLIDEADTFARDDESLRGILNSGHTRDTAFVIRCEGDDNKPQEFSTWSPKAIAAIGKLGATLRDRAIIISMRRKKPNESVTKLRAQDSEDFITLRRKAARWKSDNIANLTDMRPEIPRELNDRAADNWELLLAIADVAGGEWPSLARTAAIDLSNTEVDEDTIKVQLLVDIRAVFNSLGDCDRLFSKRLVAELTADETKPWVSFKNGKPLTERQLARLLADFGIRPTTMRIEDGRAKGYPLGDFQDVFDRYLPNQGVSIRDTVTIQKSQGLGGESIRDAEIVVTDRNDHNQLIQHTCHGVTDQNPRTLEKEGEDQVCAQCRANGQVRMYVIDDAKVWLHRECRRFYEAEKGGLPW